MNCPDCRTECTILHQLHWKGYICTKCHIRVKRIIMSKEIPQVEKSRFEKFRQSIRRKIKKFLRTLERRI